MSENNRHSTQEKGGEIAMFDSFMKIFGFYRVKGESMPVDDNGEFFVKPKVEIRDDYGILRKHLMEAYNQASEGKGKTRHVNNGQTFEQQDICEIGRRLGSYDFELGQAVKKILEAKRIHKLHGPAAAKAELHGAMNYLAGACVLIDEQG